MSDSPAATRRTEPKALIRAFSRVIARQKQEEGEMVDRVARIGLPADIDPMLAPPASKSHAARCILQAIRAMHGGKIPADTVSIETVIAPFHPQAPIRRAIEKIAENLPGDLCFRPIRKALQRLEETGQ